MPELPEVENVRRSLIPHLVGHTIRSASLLRPDICTTDSGHPPSPASLLCDANIDRIERKGKQLAVIATDGRVLSIHLGMTGQVLARATPPDPSEKHVHALWTTSTNPSNPSFILFKDPRRFGGLWTFPSIASLHALRWSLLGPDALDAPPDAWSAALRRGHRPIKAALLDQTSVAGVGNIYADEALFRTGIRPTTSTHRLTIAAATALAANVQALLAQAVEAGGSTLRDYRNADGVAGTQQLEHHVYGRSSQTCLRCGSPLQTAQVGQRTTVWCPKCQPARTIRSDSVKH